MIRCLAYFKNQLFSKTDYIVWNIICRILLEEVKFLDQNQMRFI